MSNYHIMENLNKEDMRVVFHIAAPTDTNSAGITYDAALKDYLLWRDGTIASVVPWLEMDFPTETADIQDGLIYEHEQILTFDANLTNGAKRSEIDDRYTALATNKPDQIRERLRFWGYNRDVP